MASAPALRATALQQLNDGWTDLVIDFTGCDFIDSTGLGALVGLLRRVRTRNGKLELVVPLAEQRHIFELCDLDRIFTLHDSVEAVTAGVGADGNNT